MVSVHLPDYGATFGKQLCHLNLQIAAFVGGMNSRYGEDGIVLLASL